jgi:hypothetical protein
VCRTDRWPAVSVDGHPAAVGGVSTAVPDVFLDETHLAAARSVLEREVGWDNVRLAYVSGSLAAGLGHGLSDVDVYVATMGGDPITECSFPENGSVVQITPVSEADLGLIVRICSEYTDTAATRWQTNLSDAELQRSLRYAIGTVLVDQGSGLPSTADSLLTLRRVLMTRSAFWLSSLAEDALGALQIGDLLTALQASLMAVELALECALTSAGDVYLGRKFQLRRAARSTALSEVKSDLWTFLGQPSSLAGDALGQFVVGRMLFCSHLVANGLLNGWDQPIDRVPGFEDRRAQNGPVRSPWVIPVRFADAWGMAGPDIGYRTRAGMVRLWLALDGRPTREVRLGLAEDAAFARVSPELLDAAIAQLIEVEAAVADSGHALMPEGSD